MHVDHFIGMNNLQASAIKPWMPGDDVFDKGGLTNEDQVQRGNFSQTVKTGRDNATGTEVPAHCVDRDDRSRQDLLVSALVDHFTTTVETFRGNVVAQVNFTGALFHGQGIRLERVVRTTHITGGTGFFVLLNSRWDQLLNVWVTL